LAARPSRSRRSELATTVERGTADSSAKLARVAVAEPNRLATWLRESGPPILVFIGFVATWQIACRVFEIPRFLLPAPSDIAEAWWENQPGLTNSLITTFLVALTGFVAAIIVGCRWRC